MTDADPLLGAFEDLRASKLPSIRPPGVAGVIARARHRRRAKAMAGAVSVVVAVGLGTTAYLVAPGGPGGGSTPAGPPGRIELDPSPSVPVSPVPSDAPSPTGAAATTSRITATHTRRTCVNSGAARIVDASMQVVRIKFVATSGAEAQPCAGVSVPVFWATYDVLPDGSAIEISEFTGALTATHTSMTFDLNAPAECGAWFVGFGVSDIPATLPAVQDNLDGNDAPGEAFWDNTRGGTGVIYRDSSPCTPASPSPSPSM
jgi:hypothetical protein